MTKIYFIRHAQPNYNNHNDLLRELSPKGLSDTKYVTAFLADKDISAVLSSPYKRAVDTVAAFADQYGFTIEINDDFRERKISDGWIDNFKEFSEKQWNDFNFRLPDGECLREVQDRNISALKAALKEYKGKNIAVGSHGTSLSTIINYYDSSFGYSDFEKIKDLMPWAAEFIFDTNMQCIEINKFNII